MVLLAASVCTKDGKPLVSRQFVEMTKARIEGLIATFPKLIDAGKQHTFIETDSVRYVYQTLEKLYILLITTKASNILEDLETLRLFARVIPEYAHGTDESDIVANVFQLIFAFDEIIALGYREDVNVSQIRTFTDMDSHEERVYRAIQKNKERDAKEQMKQRARELQQAKNEANKRGGSGMGGFGGAFRSSMNSFGSNTSSEARVVVMKDRLNDYDTSGGSSSSFSNTQSAAASTKRSGMKLVGHGGLSGVDQFVDQLKAEGEVVHDEGKSKFASAGPKSSNFNNNNNLSSVNKESVHFRIEEKLCVQVARDGGLENMDLQGIMYALAQTNEASTIKILALTSDATKPTLENRPSAQLQFHPNIDKKEFWASGWIQIKAGVKPFPVAVEVGILRWRIQTQDESALPLTINCWPNKIAGGFEVNIEYELCDQSLEFDNIVVVIPLPENSKAPMVGSCDGLHEFNSRKCCLEWRLPVVNSKNLTGTIEFNVKADQSTSPDAFFPIQLNFSTCTSYCGIKVLEVKSLSANETLKFSCDTNFFAENYSIV